MRRQELVPRRSCAGTRGYELGCECVKCQLECPGDMGPRSLQRLKEAGEMSLDMGHSQEAIAAFSRALVLAPADGAVLHGLAKSHVAAVGDALCKCGEKLLDDGGVGVCVQCLSASCELPLVRRHVDTGST